MAQRPPDRAVSWRALLACEVPGSGCISDLCKLSDYRVFGAALPEFCLLQRVPTFGATIRGLPGAHFEFGGRAAAFIRRTRARQPAKRRRHTGAPARKTDPNGL